MAHRHRLMLRWMSIYPPLFGARVRVRLLKESPLVFETRMRLRWWNRNYVGTHYGGSLYSMCDPFYMLILIEALGSDFVVWDKEAIIRFRRPGRGEVRARFEILAARIDELRREVRAVGRCEPTFTAAVIDSDGEVVAEVEKRLSVRLRRPQERAATDTPLAP